MKFPVQLSPASYRSGAQGDEGLLGMTSSSPHREAALLPAELIEFFEEKISAKELELPLLPDTSAQVLANCQDDNCDARTLAQLIRRDQSLAGHVLSVANSVIYAPKAPIVSLQQAVSRLGMSCIREIALAITLKARVFSVPGYEAEIREMWAHSAAAAIYAKEVARTLRRNVEGAFLCGLLHDIGRPLALQLLVDNEHDLGEFTGAEIESALDSFHARLGARIVRHWSLPSWMAESIAQHHDPDPASEFIDQSRITGLADILAQWAMDSDSAEEDFPFEHPFALELNLYADDLMALLHRREEIIEQTYIFR